MLLNKIKENFIIKCSIALITLIALSACSASDKAQQASESTLNTPPSEAVALQLVYSDQPLDQTRDGDKDGIPDVLDRYPQLFPKTSLKLNVALNGIAFNAEDAVSDAALGSPVVVQAGHWMDVVLSQTIDIANQALGDIQLVAISQAGPVLLSTRLAVNSTLQVFIPHLPISAVYIVDSGAGTQIKGTALAVNWLAADAPRIDALLTLDGEVPAFYQVGEAYRLVGENLDQLSAIKLGQSELGFIAESEQALSLSLPGYVASQQLVLINEQGQYSNAKNIKIKHALSIGFDEIPKRWSQIQFVAGSQVVRLSREQALASAFSLWLDTPNTLKLRVHGIQANGEEHLDIAKPLLMPGQRALQISLADEVEKSEGLTPVRAYKADKNEPLIAYSFTDESLNFYNPSISTPHFAIPVISLLAPDTAQGLRGFWQTMAYENIRVLSADSADCKASFAGLSNLGANPHDLCVENDSFVYISAQVSDRSGQVLLSHAQNLFDSKIIDTVWGGLANIASISFLSSDATENPSEPLCHGINCQVEVITGGLGVLNIGEDLGLSAAEQSLNNKLIVRTLTDSVVMPFIEHVMGFEPPNCLSALIVPRLINVMTKTDLVFKLSEPGADPFAVLVDYLGKEAIGELLGEIFSYTKSANGEGVSACMKRFAKPNAEDAAKRLAKFAGKNAVPIVGLAVQVAEIANTSLGVSESLATPPKMVFGVRYSTHVSELLPQALDLDALILDTAADIQLVVKGTYLADANAANAYPKLVLKGSNNTRAEIQVTNDMVSSENGQGANTGKVQDVIRVDLNNAAVIEQLSGLMGERLSLELTYQGDIAQGYNNRRVTLKTNVAMDFRGTALVNKVYPKLAKGGDRIRLLGNRLSSYAGTATVELYSGAIRYPDIPVVAGGDDNELSFYLPEGVDADEYFIELTLDDKPLLAKAKLVVKQDSQMAFHLLDSGPDYDDTVSLSLYKNDTLLSLPSGQSDFILQASELNRRLSVLLPDEIVPDEIRLECIDSGTDDQCIVQLSADAALLAIAAEDDVPQVQRYIQLSTAANGQRQAVVRVTRP